MATAQYDTVIAESQHIFDNKALQLAERFFDIEETSLLKVGSFGYTTALYSHMMRDSTFHRNMLFNEFFLTSASLNSTLYNWAKILDYDVDLSSPAQIPVAIKINLSELQRISSPSIVNGNNLEYVITRDKVFDVGGFNFLLPYDLRISILKNNAGQVTISAIYDFESFNFKPHTLKSPYLKTTMLNDNGVMSVVIAAQIYQIKGREYIFNMASNDILDVGIIEQNYGANIVSFRAMYSDNSNNVDSFRDIEAIFNEITIPSTDLHAYYTYVGGDTLRLYFSNRPADFRPAFNSKVKIEIFTTDAEKGNFNYNGKISIRDPNLEGSSYSCTPLASSATGGASGQSFRETKIALMQRLRTRNSITTSYDLQTYFDQIKKETLDTKSDFSVVKLRDDILRRQFSLFILSRNTSGEVIPTNTVDIELSLDEIADVNYSLKPGDMIVYDRIERTYRLLKEDELPEAYLKSSDSYLYCIPFLINIDFKEFPKANIFFTNYEKTIGLNYEYLNLNTPYEIVVNSFNISRNPLYDTDFFNISTFINTNSIDIAEVVVRSILYKGNQAIGYADLTRVGNTSEFSVQVNAPDEFDKDGNYIVRDTFRDIETGVMIPEILLDGDYHLQMGFLIRSNNNQQEKTGIFAKMQGLENYILVSVLASTETISFADNLSSVMYCQVKYNEISGKMQIKHIPVVGALAYLNQDQNTQVMNDLFNGLNTAKLVSQNLENNTKIDVKMFNTYGASKYFDIDTIDLKLKFTIALNTSADKFLSKQIKDFVAEYIDSCNISNLERRFSFSNLIRLLETNFSEIKFIKFFTINGGNIQSIRQIKFVDAAMEELPIDYVPEFLNVKKVMPVSDSDSWFDFSIDITYE